MEELEYIPGHYVVRQFERPRLACTCCEKVTQAEMPSRPIPKSFVGPVLMAHILCCKYSYHLPLYRQSQMFENEGIDLSGALLASWVGKCCRLLECLSDAVRDHIFSGPAIFMDDTPVRLLQRGKGRGKNKPKTARLWVYARDEKPWGSSAPPAVFALGLKPMATSRLTINSLTAEALIIQANILRAMRAMPMSMLIVDIMMPSKQAASTRWPASFIFAVSL